MRKLSVTVTAAAAILLVVFGADAMAAGISHPNAVKNFSPIQEAACEDLGPIVRRALFGHAVDMGVVGAAPAGSRSELQRPSNRAASFFLAAQKFHPFGTKRALKRCMVMSDVDRRSDIMGNCR